MTNSRLIGAETNKVWGSTVVQRIALSPHSKKVQASNTGSGHGSGLAPDTPVSSQSPKTGESGEVISLS